MIAARSAGVWPLSAKHPGRSIGRSTHFGDGQVRRGPAPPEPSQVTLMAEFQGYDRYLMIVLREYEGSERCTMY